MKKYGFFQALYKCFYSGNLYRDVGSNWGAEVGWYLLMVLALCWALTTVGIYKELTNSYDQLATDIVHQLPAFQIKEGQVIAPENRPYIVRNSKTEQPIIVLDTSGKYQSLEQAHSTILITKDTFRMQQPNANANEERVIKLNKNVTTQFVPIDMKKTTDFWVKLSWLLIFPLCLFGAFLYRIIQSLVYALLGKTIALLVGVPLSYGNIVKLCIVALTPTIIVGTLFSWFNILFPFQPGFYFLLSMGYLAFAICAQKKTSK